MRAQPSSLQPFTAAQRRRPSWSPRACVRALGERQVLQAQITAAQRRRPRSPGRTSDPLKSTVCCACHATQEAASQERQGVRPTHAVPSGAVAATRPTGAPGPCVRPLGERQVLRLPRKSHAAVTQRTPSLLRGGAPGRTSDPLKSTKRCA